MARKTPSKPGMPKQADKPSATARRLSIRPTTHRRDAKKHCNLLSYVKGFWNRLAGDTCLTLFIIGFGVCRRKHGSLWRTKIEMKRVPKRSYLSERTKTRLGKEYRRAWLFSGATSVNDLANVVAIHSARNEDQRLQASRTLTASARYAPSILPLQLAQWWRDNPETARFVSRSLRA